MFTLEQRMDERALVSGNESIAFIIFPDGRRKILANVLKLDARVKNNKKTVVILGRRNKVHKKGISENTGKMTMYFNSSVFREAEQAYKDNGRDSFYDILVINADEDSIVGEQSVLLKGVNFDETVIALIDAEAEFLTEDAGFTFNDWHLNNVFSDGGLINA